MVKIGANIALFRAKAGLTQEGLSIKIGVSLPTLARWERNISQPRASDITKLCKVLSVTEAELLNGPATHEIEIRVVVEETNSWEVEKMNLTDNGPGTFSVHIGPSKVGIYVSGKFDGPEDLDDVFARARKMAEKTLANQGDYREATPDDPNPA